MNERDFVERDACAIVVTSGSEAQYDDVTTAVLFKKRSIEILSKLLPATEIGSLEWAVLRLEIQTERSCRLHAHSLVRTRRGKDNVLNVVTVARRDLRGDTRRRRGEAFFRRAAHHCMGDKCGEECKYDFPNTEYSEVSFIA